MFETMLEAMSWAAQQEAPEGPRGLSPVMLAMIAIFILFWFMLIAPQKREQRKREEMLKNVQKGDSVVTAGGIHGTVESVDSERDIVTINVAPKINIKFNRSSVSSVEPKKPKKD